MRETAGVLALSVGLGLSAELANGGDLDSSTWWLLLGLTAVSFVAAFRWLTS